MDFCCTDNIDCQCQPPSSRAGGTRREHEGKQDGAAILVGDGIGQFLEHTKDASGYIGAVEIVLGEAEKARFSHRVNVYLDHQTSGQCGIGIHGLSIASHNVFTMRS